MLKLAALLLILPLALAACGGASASEPTPTPMILKPNPFHTPTPTTEVTMPATGSEATTPVGGATPTLAPTYTPTPEPTIEPTATPQPTAIPAATPTPTPTPEPTPAPTATPIPTPTLRYQPAAPAASAQFADYKADGVTFTTGPTVVDDVLRVKAEMRSDLEPTEVQVWQSRDYPNEQCPTDRPIAVTAPGRTGHVSMSWMHCVNPDVVPGRRTDNIPWVAAETWTYGERPRGNSIRDSLQPRIWDFNAVVNLSIPDVWRLEYVQPAGYIIVIFSGDTLISKTWVDF